MLAIGVVAICFAVYAAGYLLYSRFIAQQMFALRPDHPTPAHTLEDGVDYGP
jgi:carbon starvation protein